MSQGRTDHGGVAVRAAVDRLRAMIGEAAFDRYFASHEPDEARTDEGLAHLERDEGRLRVRVPSRFAGSLIERRFGPALQEAAGAGGLGSASIEVDARASWRRPSDDSTRDAPSAHGRSPGAGRPGSSSGLDAVPGARAHTARPGAASSRSAGPRAGSHAGAGARSRPADSNTIGRRLEDFVVGPSNREAYEAACRMGDPDRDPGFGPLVIYGPCGVGKTHLLRGVASRFGQTSDGRPALVRTTTAEAFTSAYIESVRSGNVAAFQRSFRRVSLLCIDDIHFLAKKDGTQRELLHTFDALDLNGARIVLVSDEHPRDIRMLSEPLVSRFIGGVVVRVGAPDDALAERIVTKLATRSGLVLGSGAAKAAVTWIRSAAAARGGERVHASARELAGAVARLKATAGVSPELLSPDGSIGAVLVDAALSPRGAAGDGASGRGAIGSGRASIRAIVDASADALGVSVSELMGRGRHRRVVLARSIASYLCREMTNHSTPEIAVKLGRPNHSTVVTASRRLASKMEASERVSVGCSSDGLLVSDLVAQVRRRVSAGG
ncbi:MAG: DnaA/Hda family protein [Planctomycetota bacterium]